MSDKFFLAYGLPLVFLLIGIVLLLKAVRHGRQTRAFRAKAHEAIGEVVAIKKVPPQNPGENDVETYRPVLTFLTSSGQQVRFESMVSSYPSKYAVGDAVRVLYDPNRASEARIHAWADLWLMPTLFGGLGMVFFMVGFALLTGAIVP